VRIDKLISYLQNIEKENPGLDVIIPIPIGKNILTGAVVVMLNQNTRTGVKVASLIGISQDQQDAIVDIAKRKEIVPGGKITTFEVEDVFGLRDD
jgi:hypothetical protein